MEGKDMALVVGGLATVGIAGYFLWKSLQEEPTPPVPPAEGVDITYIKII